MAQQFALAGGGAFSQPLRLPEASGSFVGIPATDVADRLVLVASGNPDRPVRPATIDPTISTSLLPALAGPFNNFGVPGAKSIHLPLGAYGNPSNLGSTANPFFVRFASSQNATVIGDAAARAPTFFVLWIGNNDILGNATAGSPGFGAAPGVPVIGTGSNEVTDPAAFDATYPVLVFTLTASSPGNKGVLVNIPDVSTIPYFTTVPYDAIPLSSADAAALNAQLADAYDLALNAAIGLMLITNQEADARRIRFSEGANQVLISDETLTDISAVLAGPLAPLAALAQARPATPDDLIVLPASARLGVEDTPGNPLTKWGVTLPLEDTDVLIKAEVDSLEIVRAAYNATIKAQADADPDLIYFDAAALLHELSSTGISYGSGGISSAFIQGGGFSLDGVHPTARGYAVIANEMFKAIEKAFGAKIPPVDPNQYTTVFYR